MSVLYNLWAQLPSAGLLWAGSQESRFLNITVTGTPGLPQSLFSLYKAFQSSYLSSSDLKSTKKYILTQALGGMAKQAKAKFPKDDSGAWHQCWILGCESSHREWSHCGGSHTSGLSREQHPKAREDGQPHLLHPHLLSTHLNFWVWWAQAGEQHISFFFEFQGRARPRAPTESGTQAGPPVLLLLWLLPAFFLQKALLGSHDNTCKSIETTQNQCAHNMCLLSEQHRESHLCTCSETTFDVLDQNPSTGTWSTQRPSVLSLLEIKSFRVPKSKRIIKCPGFNRNDSQRSVWIKGSNGVRRETSAAVWRASPATRTQ